MDLNNEKKQNMIFDEEVKTSEQTVQEEDNRVKPHKIKWWHFPFLILLIVGTIYVSRTSEKSAASKNSSDEIGDVWAENVKQRCEGEIFGTVYHITYSSQTDLKTGIDSVLLDVDNSLSPFNPKSVISHVNDNTSNKVDSNFIKVYNISRYVAEMTDGAFDITVAPLVNAWGFGFKNMADVSEEQIANLLNHVGYKKIDLKGNTIMKSDSAIMLDCSAVAKGYGVDAVSEYLQSKGVDNYMVEIGGEVRVFGCNPMGTYWKIGILKPEDDSLGLTTDVEQVLKISDISMATSGNYRNYYEKGDKKYAHTIDPRTGYPVQHTILSSTVLAKDCATADAFATSFMVMGLDKAKEVLKKEKNICAYFIYSVGGDKTAEWCSEELESKKVY